MVFTSKTIIPGKEPIGRNKDGSYIYDGVQAPNMSVMPSQGTYDTGKQMSVVPKVWTPPTPVPMVKSPVGFNIMPKVDPVIAAKVNAPIEDVKGILQVDKTDPRIQKLEQHFKTLKQKGGLQLNQKQTEYVQRYKKNLPQYANVPDALLFGRIIMKYPEAQEKYGNIGDKSLLKRIVGLPLDLAKTGSDAIMEAQDVFAERQKTLNKGGNLGITNLLAGASAGRALGTGVMGMAGDVLNVASPFINPETGVTSVTEGLGRDMGTMVEKVPEEYRQQISDLMVKYPKISATLGVGFDLSNLIPFLGVLGKAKSASQVDDILRQVKTRPATKFRGEVSQDVFDAGMNRSVVKDVAQIPVKTAKTTLRGAEKTGEFVGETAIATGVGLSKPSQQAIKTTPELYKQARTGALTRETATDEVVSTLKKRLGELSDTGKEYNTIRQSTVTMPKQDFGKILDDFFKENDISKIDMPVKDRKVVQQAIDYIAEYDDVLSAKNGLSLRRKLDDLADWSTEATGEGKRLIRKLRGRVDEYLGGKIPGLKDLDAKYAPEVAFLRKVKTGVLNADGTIKDSAISYVANIVGKGKEVKLDRLEQLLPGIGQKVRALKAFEEVQAISSMKTGSIARQLGGIITGSTLGGPIGLVAGFVATNPNLVAFALEKYGMAKKAIQAILKKGAKITPDEAIKVKQAVDSVPSKEAATFLLGAGEQRKLLMPPKQGDSIVQRLAKSDSPTPSFTSPSVSSVESNKQKLLPTPQKPQVESGISSVLSQLSKEKSKSAGKKVNNSIIEKLAKKQETPKTPQVEGKTVEYTVKGGDDIPEKMTGKVYHGTNANFDKFDSKYFGKGEGSDKLGQGVYLTTDAKRAKEYGKNVMEVDIGGTKLVNYDNIKHQEGFYDFLEKYKGRKGRNPAEVVGDAKEEFAKKNFDGIRYGNDEILIFSPEKARIISKPSLPLSQKSEVKYSEPIDLSNAESDLIFDYTKSGGGTSKPMGLEKQKRISNVIKKLPENTETVYSGQKPSNETLSELDSGEFISKKLISSSTEKRVAQEFMDYNPSQRNQAFFTIEGGGHDISKFSQFNHSIGGEKEILFPIGTKFKVEKTGSNTYTLYPQ